MVSGESKKSAIGPESSKSEIRARALRRRRDLADKDRRSRAICERFQNLQAFRDCGTLLVYMHLPNEVGTDELVKCLLESRKKLVVPYCRGDDLGLFLLSRLDDLSIGTFGILEPLGKLRSDVERQVEPTQLDLLAIPGIAFDRHGGRVGHGRGYFDRLLKQIRPDAVTVGLAFECQLFDRVPMEDHDVPLDGIVTEHAAYFSR